jgi:hypothetical protein
MPIELITMIGGSITGFIFRYMAERAKERASFYQMALGMKKAEDESADKAAKRVPIDCMLHTIRSNPSAICAFPLGVFYHRAG